MGNQWESHSATLNYGKFVTTKTLDVSRRAFSPDQIKVKEANGK